MKYFYTYKLPFSDGCKFTYWKVYGSEEAINKALSFYKTVEFYIGDTSKKDYDSYVESMLAEANGIYFNYSEVPANKGCRFFLKRNGVFKTSVGFCNKKEASDWINNLTNRDGGSKLNWRVGFLFRVKGDEYDMEIVNKKGERL